MVDASKEYIVESPFYLRARIQDSQTASVLFEIPRKDNHRTCKMYKFTIRRDRELPYSMPEVNLTYWRNSLELKHLAAGHYRVCAIICSEHLRHANYHYEHYATKNRTVPIIACVHFQAFRTHRLIFMLYVLVLIFLAISQIIYSLRKRQFKARIKLALIELENALQKRRTTETPSLSAENTQSYTILQSLVTLPASPVEQAVTTIVQPNDEEQHPIIFHLDIPNEH